MNSCFIDKDFKDCSALPDLPKMRKLFMRDVGLIYTANMHIKMPNLEVLDL